MKSSRLRCVALALLNLLAAVPRLPAGLPQSLAEAESFARTLIDQELYQRLGVLRNDQLKKLRVQRNDAGTATTFFLPRSTRSDPDFTIEVVISPRNAPLSPGHQRAHEPMQRHRYTDYPDPTPYATQREEYDRSLPCLGAETACVTVSMEKRRADAVASVNHLELAWLPADQQQFGIIVRLRNLQLNLRPDGQLGSDAVHTMLDKHIATLVVALARTASTIGAIGPAPAAACEELYRAVMALPHYPPDSPAYTAAAVAPRPLTVAAYRASPSAMPPAQPAATTPSTPPAPTAGALVWLEPPEVEQLCAQQALSSSAPQPTPRLSLILPPEATNAAAGAPAFDKATLLTLLLAPDLRLMVTKERAGFSATVYVHARGDWAAVVAETDEGYHLPVITLKPAFPTACAAFLHLAAPRPPPPPLELRLAPARLAVLRSLFELQESTRVLAGSEVADLASFSLPEIMACYASPRMLGLTEALPEAAQWEVQAIAGNPMLLALELTALRQHRLLTRTVVRGAPVYRLSADGLSASRELFAPPERIRVTRVPARLVDRTPAVYLTNLAAFVGPRTAFMQHLPDGVVRYRRGAWQGGASIWELFDGLTEPEP